jgi:hypothetical protein
VTVPALEFVSGLGYGDTDMKGYILTAPILIDERHISFVFFDEAGKREISCQTYGNSDAPAMLENMKGWKQVFIDGGWITDDKGRPGVFRVDRILPKTEEATAENKA